MVGRVLTVGLIEIDLRGIRLGHIPVDTSVFLK